MRALLLFVGLLFALSAVGIDLTALSVLGGAIGVGVGFGLQKIAANYVSGFVILAERALRIGDMVKVDGFEGRITDIRTRYTVIRALNGRESIVPNEMLITQRVENSSLADPRVLVQDRGAGRLRHRRAARLPPMLEAAIAAVPRVIAEPGPAVQLAAFAPDGMELTISVLDPRPRERHGQRASRTSISRCSTCSMREGIEIPFPQRVVHATLSNAKSEPADRGTAAPRDESRSG